MQSPAKSALNIPRFSTLERFGLITQGQNAISLAGVTMIGAINQEICISRVHSPFRGKLDKDLCQCARRIQAIFRGCGRGSRLAFAWHKLKTRSIAVSFQDSTFMGLFSLCMWGRASREWALILSSSLILLLLLLHLLACEGATTPTTTTITSSIASNIYAISRQSEERALAA